jgi:hypothetical protein
MKEIRTIFPLLLSGERDGVRQSRPSSKAAASPKLYVEQLCLLTLSMINELEM